MAMSEQERQQYLAEISPQIEAAADRVFTEVFGRSYSDVDMKRARLPHAERNGDASHQPDTWRKIQRDFPDLFGGAA